MGAGKTSYAFEGAVVVLTAIESREWIFITEISLEMDKRMRL
jgi:hypothetical protein